MNKAITVDKLSKNYVHSRVALNAISFEIEAGEMVALIGASGSGKSTLLRLISGLMPANAGSVSAIQVLGREIQSAGRVASDIRDSRAQVGLIFQQFNLVDRLSVLTNVLTGMLHRVPSYRSLLGIFKAEEKQLAIQALNRVGIGQCLYQRAGTLSGGQQQRAAIARTMVQKAQIVLADEPIASLDPESSRMVMELLSEMNRQDGCTILVSLHQIQTALKYCPRTIALSHGDIVYDGPSHALTPNLLRELYGVEAEELLGDTHLTLNDTPDSIEPAPSLGTGALPSALNLASV
jgi:phosphonate transport system ATP-binding protein